MRKKITTLFTVLCALSCTLFNSNLYAEGSKQLLPNSTDELALYCNSSLYYNFAQYDGTDEQRLYIHIENPETEQVFLGFSQPHTKGHDPLGSLTSGYFRIKDPSGTVVYAAELINGTTANITNRAQAVAGPNEIVTSGGYDAFIFNPDGLSAGDYYIEFNLQETTYNSSHLLFRYFDITVANEGGSPAAIDGRIYSKNWALFAPSIDYDYNSTYSVYDRPVNGSFHVLSSENFVSKIDFNNSNFQPAAFNIAVNSWGTRNSGDNFEDRKSLNNQKSILPELKIFLNDPDPVVYPSGEFGEMITDPDYPAIIGCPATGYHIRVATTSSGLVELLLDFDQATGAGKYDLGTDDLLLFYNVIPGAGETPPYIRDIPWDGNNANGNPATSVPIGTEVSFSQGGYHIPVYDVEFNLNGFGASVVRPTTVLPLKFYHDDVNITSGTTELENGCDPNTAPSTPCHTWTDSLYGDINTINTYWYAKQEIEISNITVTSPDCGCSVSGVNISGKVYNDSDANGLKGNTENGSSLSNIDAILYEDVNKDGLIDAGDITINTQPTDGNGDYSFAVTLTGTPSTENLDVVLGSDDAEENPFTGTSHTDNTINLGFNGFANTQVGLRFQNVVIPQGTTISNAYIEFTASSTTSTGSSTSYTIKVEESDNATTFLGGGTDISTRTTTGATNWTTPDWAAETTYQTADIKTLVQTITNRPGWASGQNMVFIIDGTVARNSYSFNEGSGKEPKLVIEYTDFGLPIQYLVALDPTDFPGGKNLSTDNIEKTLLESLEYNDCENYFGLVPPLPVELSSFTAKEKDCKVIVEWTAAIEDNLSHYELEHGKFQNNFTTKASFNSELTRSNANYSYTDLAADEHNYYRLKMVDLDGSIEYSKVIALNLACKNSYSLDVYPNPVKGGSPLQIRIQTEQREATLVITNVLGKVVRVLNLSTDIGLNSAQIDVSDLPNGTYFIIDEKAMKPVPVKFMKN